jgi:hypothetical protein
MTTTADKYAVRLSAISSANAPVVVPANTVVRSTGCVSLQAANTEARVRCIPVVFATTSRSVEQAPQRWSFSIATLRDCKEATGFSEKQIRKFEMQQALDDAFQSGGKVFDDAFWEEAKKKRAS